MATVEPGGNKKRAFQNRGKGKTWTHSKKIKTQAKPVNRGETSEEILLLDVQELLASQRSQAFTTSIEEPSKETQPEISSDSQPRPLPELFQELQVEVKTLSSTGDGLAIHPDSDQVYVVPFTAPGDVIKARPYKHFRDQGYSLADFVSVEKPSSMRDDTRIKCPYFSKCSGCQFQMLSYPNQLEHKRRIVEKAYKNFSDLPPELIPTIQETMGSPLEYGYRTKLTPHFDGPPGPRRVKHGQDRPTFSEVPPIGFMQKGTRKTLDIEDCPIGTDAVRLGMKRERSRVASEISKYKKGATILLRESTSRHAKDSTEEMKELPADAVRVEGSNYVDIKTCITDNNATSTEYIDDYVFTNTAGAFFQNNNSILSPFTQYIRSQAVPADDSEPSASGSKIKYLIDAYSGSGLFTITLSSLFTSSTGIDISAASIASARENARLNGLATTDPTTSTTIAAAAIQDGSTTSPTPPAPSPTPHPRCTFTAADAAHLFSAVRFDPAATLVVIDPPRKGCDLPFLRQLLRFAPRRIVYVSCNVHTQARDVGVLVRGRRELERGGGGEEGMEAAARSTSGGEDGGVGGSGDASDADDVRYAIASLRGFDFFPQTGHVEGVAVLNRVE